jgi:hypothetical protein
MGFGARFGPVIHVSTPLFIHRQATLQPSGDALPVIVNSQVCFRFGKRELVLGVIISNRFRLMLWKGRAGIKPKLRENGNNPKKRN